MRTLFVAFMVLVMSCKSGPTDEKIQSDLLTTLSASYPGVTAYVKDGVATLSGTCPDESCKNSSETAAKGVKGVKSVVNNVVVSQPPAAPTVEVAPSDSLQTAVSSLLSAYKGVNGKVENGVVTLTGEIKRAQLRTLMQSVNELKPKKVENKLVIK